MLKNSEGKELCLLDQFCMSEDCILFHPWRDVFTFLPKGMVPLCKNGEFCDDVSSGHLKAFQHPIIVDKKPCCAFDEYCTNFEKIHRSRYHHVRFEIVRTGKSNSIIPNYPPFVSFNKEGGTAYIGSEREEENRNNKPGKSAVRCEIGHAAGGKSGFGLDRDGLQKLLLLVGTMDIKKIRAIYGMCQELYLQTKHARFWMCVIEHAPVYRPIWKYDENTTRYYFFVKKKAVTAERYRRTMGNFYNIRTHVPAFPRTPLPPPGLTVALAGRIVRSGHMGHCEVLYHAVSRENIVSASASKFVCSEKGRLGEGMYFAASEREAQLKFRGLFSSRCCVLKCVVMLHRSLEVTGTHSSFTAESVMAVGCASVHGTGYMTGPEWVVYDESQIRILDILFQN